MRLRYEIMVWAVDLYGEGGAEREIRTATSLGGFLALDVLVLVVPVFPCKGGLDYSRV